MTGNAQTVIGIDTSFDSLRLPNEIMSGDTSCHLFQMNAVHLVFRDSQFDLVICVQNGISAFKVNQRDLIKEALHITRVGGTVLWRIALSGSKLKPIADSSARSMRMSLAMVS